MFTNGVSWQMKDFNKTCFFQVWNSMKMRRKINKEISIFICSVSCPWSSCFSTWSTKYTYWWTWNMLSHVRLVVKASLSVKGKVVVLWSGHQIRAVKTANKVIDMWSWGLRFELWKQFFAKMKRNFVYNKLLWFRSFTFKKSFAPGPGVVFFLKKKKYEVNSDDSIKNQ